MKVLEKIWITEWYSRFEGIKSMVDALPTFLIPIFLLVIILSIQILPTILENSLILLNLGNYKSELCENLHMLSQQLAKALLTKTNIICRVTLEKYKDILSTLLTRIETPQQLQSKVDFISGLDAKVKDLEGVYKDCVYVYDALDEVSTAAMETDSFRYDGKLQNFQA